MIQLLLIALWLSAARVLAAADPADLWHEDRVLLLGHDDPRQLVQLVEPIIKRGPEGQEELWVRAVFADSTIAADYGRRVASPEALNQAIAIAERLHMRRESLGIRLSMLTSSDARDLNLEYQKLRDEARKLALPFVELQIVRRHAYWLYDRGNDLECVNLQKEAAALLDQLPDASIVERIRLEADMAMVFDDQSPSPRALQLYQNIQKECQAWHLRWLCVTNTHELGLHFKPSENPEDWAKAEAYFIEAQRLAQDIGETWAAAKSQAALGEIYTMQKRYAEAIRVQLQAIQVFEKFENTIWIGDAYKKLGRSYVAAEQYDKAIVALEKAKTFFSEDYLLDHREISRLLAECYEKQGKSTEAIEQLRRHIEINSRYVQERESREYSRAMADIGLNVEEERNKVLEADNALQKEKLQAADRVRLLLLITLALVAVAISALILARYRSLQFRRGERHMRRILEQIHEGILSIDPQLRIQEGCSRSAATLFGEPLAGRHILDDILSRSTLTTDELGTMGEILKLSMEEGSLTWELNQHNLPAEIVWGENPSHLLSLQWQPIMNSRGALGAILLSFRDISKNKELEKQIETERQMHSGSIRRLQELLPLGQEKASRIFHDGRLLIARIETNEKPAHDLHTLKGLARSFGLRDMSQAVHACEDALGREEWPARWAELQAVWASYLALESHTAVSKAGDRTFLGCIDNHVIQLRQRCAELGLDFDRISLSDGVKQWPTAVLQQIDAILIHAINNAVDHGFRQARKPVHIDIEARNEARRIRILIRDNGSGVNWSYLRERAQALGRPASSEEDLAELVFADGVSTAQTLTETSGRGMGMGAMRSLCRQLGGDIVLRSNDKESGAMLILEYPQEQSLAKAS